MKQQVLSRHKNLRKNKGGPKSTTIAAYTGVFLLIMSIVAIGYRPPQSIEALASASTSAPATDQVDQPSVDQLVATNIAANIAERADLPIAPNVANLSVSLSVRSELSQGDTAATVSKPQIIQPTAGSREIKTYTAKAGDTAEGVSSLYGISATTLKWANNIASDAIEANKQLMIPPVDGVVYVVKDGDTVDSLAAKYGADKTRIVSFNDLELAGVKTGMKIIIPGGVLPDTERPGYVAPRPVYVGGGTSGGTDYSVISSSVARASAGNRYAFGNCTWYAYERRAQLGRPVGSFWGNGAEWDNSARAAGFLVDRTPEPGAIQVMEGGAGHVAIVEEVYSDGSIRLSEMNYAGNFNRVTSRTMSAGSAGGFNYIH
ncbi:MAG: CHAP domain-containing protein [Candidatus Saccharimonadales bacterium]